MKLPSNLMEQIVLRTRPKIEEHVLIDVDKPIHEEHQCQPFQTNNKQLKIAVTFSTGYNDVF